MAGDELSGTFGKPARRTLRSAVRVQALDLSAVGAIKPSEQRSGRGLACIVEGSL